MSKYDIEIDVQDYSIDGPFWRNYGTLISAGNSLNELLDNATVDIIDQDGGEVAIVAADAKWMQDLIEAEFYRKYGQSAGGGGNALVGFISGLLIAVNVHAMVNDNDSQLDRRPVVTVSQMGTSRWCLYTDYGLKLCAYESLSACQDAVDRRGKGVCVPNYD